jgi:hypothetical protein
MVIGGGGGGGGGGKLIWLRNLVSSDSRRNIELSVKYTIHFILFSNIIVVK